MQVHRVVSQRQASRADWWQEQAQRVLAESGFEPYISELFITDQSAELDLVRSLPDPMTSVALGLRVASFSSSSRISASTAGETSRFRREGAAGAETLIAFNSSRTFRPPNRCCPAAHSYATTPSEKMSLCPVTGCPESCSGDM